MLKAHQRYLLENVFRSPDDPAAPPAPAAGAAASPGPDAAPAAAPHSPADAAAAPSGEAAPSAPAEAAKTESPPSLLATADAGKRDGAPKPDAAAKPADAPPPGGSDATDAKSDKADAAAKPAEAKDAKPAAEGDKAPDGKTGEAKADGTDAAADKEAAGKTAEAEQQPPAQPVFDAWKLPEGVKLGDTEQSQFNGILGELELAKGDHAKTQEVGQKLVDLHLGEIQRVADQLARHQVEHWNRFVEGQINELKADQDFGGNRLETSLGNAKYVIESMMGLSADEAGNLVKALDAGGVSSNRLFIKALNKFYERHREPGPVPSQDPAASSLMSNRNRQPGQRGWYEQVDGVTRPT